MTDTYPPYHLVIGLGASGLSMAKFLHSKGVRVIATDINPVAEKHLESLNALKIETQIGFHDQKTFDQAQVLVPSPGIPLNSPYIKTAVDNGVPITGELDIFSRDNTKPVIAITGTNGKTTTTTLIGDLLKACGKKVFVGGNIGTPLVEALMSGEKYDIIVAEISSFQIDLSAHFKPRIGILLNISDDHLDRYPSINDYHASKWRLFKNQDRNDTAIVNRSTPGFENAAENIKALVISFSSEPETRSRAGAKIFSDLIEFDMKGQPFEIRTKSLPQLRGAHNHENIAAAVLACLEAGCNMDEIIPGLNSFKNLPHRLEWVRRINGVSFYNDSKATNTDAVIRALECFDTRVVLILGGREKGTDFNQLKEAVQGKVKTILAIGESKDNVNRTFSNICPVIPVSTMEDAVRKGYEYAAPNGAVLLSPACASFDMYDNYGHRGNDFKAAVNNIKEAE